jgi:hypothetical protein
MELNRGGVGVPLHKLASVVHEAQKFLTMLGDDVHIDASAGEWLGFDFDNKSLNFTAEFVGPVKPEQVREFQAAFDGVTLMRRATIAQFARIAEAIEEDEMIGFGLYQNDAETEPGEWRSLSKRDALRISEEIRTLVDRAGAGDGESRLPAPLDTEAATSLFKDRRDHAGLAERVARLENEISRHSSEIQDLRGTTSATEQNLEKLLVTVDAFCERATRQIERIPAAAPAPVEEDNAGKRRFRWTIPVAIAAMCAVAGFGLFRGLVGPRPTAGRVQASDPVTPAPTPAPEPTATLEAPVSSKSVTVELKAEEPSWVAAYVNGEQTFSKLLGAGESTTIEGEGTIRVRIGNAGAVAITANGKELDRVGHKGQARTVEFTAAGSRVVSSAGK